MTLLLFNVCSCFVVAVCFFVYTVVVIVLVLFLLVVLLDFPWLVLYPIPAIILLYCNCCVNVKVPMLFLLLWTPPLQCLAALHTPWAKHLCPVANLIHLPEQVPWIHWEWELGPELVLSPLLAAWFWQGPEQEQHG